MNKTRKMTAIGIATAMALGVVGTTAQLPVEQVQAKSEVTKKKSDVQTLKAKQNRTAYGFSGKPLKHKIPKGQSYTVDLNGKRIVAINGKKLVMVNYKKKPVLILLSDMMTDLATHG